MPKIEARSAFLGDIQAFHLNELKIACSSRIFCFGKDDFAPPPWLASIIFWPRCRSAFCLVQNKWQLQNRSKVGKSTLLVTSRVFRIPKNGGSLSSEKRSISTVIAKGSCLERSCQKRQQFDSQMIIALDHQQCQTLAHILSSSPPAAGRWLHQMHVFSSVKRFFKKRSADQWFGKV